jgi:hypothetical protein
MKSYNEIFIFLINLHFQPYQEFLIHIVFHQFQVSKEISSELKSKYVVNSLTVL